MLINRQYLKIVQGEAIKAIKRDEWTDDDLITLLCNRRLMRGLATLPIQDHIVDDFALALIVTNN